MTADEIIEKLEPLENPVNIAGMARFGIVTKKAFGIPMPVLKDLAKAIKKQADDRHGLALELWQTGIHEARIIAYLIDDPKRVTIDQMDDWAGDFDNWAICDGTCGHLFCKTSFAYQKVLEWSAHEDEFIKRAGIVLIAWLTVHDKKASDEKIAEFLPLLEREARDDRNFIKKAVNWSLRQIGKQSLQLNKLAVETAERIKAQDTKHARWIASDALRELKNEKTVERLQKKSSKKNIKFRETENCDNL